MAWLQHSVSILVVVEDRGGPLYSRKCKTLLYLRLVFGSLKRHRSGSDKSRLSHMCKVSRKFEARLSWLVVMVYWTSVYWMQIFR